MRKKEHFEPVEFEKFQIQQFAMDVQWKEELTYVKN